MPHPSIAAGRRPLALLATAVFGLCTTAAWFAAPLAAAVAPRVGARYVALGDSYAAGYGIGKPTGKPVAGCAQSPYDYPHQVAAKLHLKLTDVSCSGAVTANLLDTPQVTGPTTGTAPVQDKALSTKTKLVSVTIGGNDLGFAKIAAYCVALTSRGPLAQHPTESDCKTHYTQQANDLDKVIRQVVVPNVKNVLADIHARAPHAAVYYVDYPAISTTAAGAPDSHLPYPDSCFAPFPVTPQTQSRPDTVDLSKNPRTNNGALPYTATDIVYLQQVQQRLNAALKAAVIGAGDHFVESYPQSLAHSACTGPAYAPGSEDPWMNGIAPDATTQSVAGAGSLHPNREGADHLALELLAAIGPRAAAARSSGGSSSSASTSTSSSSSSSSSSTLTSARLVRTSRIQVITARASRRSSVSGSSAVRMCWPARIRMVW